MCYTAFLYNEGVYLLFTFYYPSNHPLAVLAYPFRGSCGAGTPKSQTQNLFAATCTSYHNDYFHPFTLYPKIFSTRLFVVSNACDHNIMRPAVNKASILSVAGSCVSQVNV